MGVWSRLSTFFGTKKAPRKNSPKFNKVKFQQLLNKNEFLNPTGPSYTIANNEKLEPTKRRKITNMLKAFGRGLIPASNPNQRTAKQKRLAKEESEKRGRITKTFNARRASHKKNLNNAFEKLQIAKNKIGNVGLNVTANNVEAFEKAYKKYGLLKQNYKSSYNEKYNAKNFNDNFMKNFFNASEGRRALRMGRPRVPNADESSESEEEEEAEEAVEDAAAQLATEEAVEDAAAQLAAAEPVVPTLAALRKERRNARVGNFFRKFGPRNEFPGQLAVANAVQEATEQIAKNVNDQEIINRTLSDFNEYKTKYMAAETSREKATYLPFLKRYYNRLLDYQTRVNRISNNPFSNPFSRILSTIPPELIRNLK